MKPTSLLLAASLLANVALVAVFATRYSAPSAAPTSNTPSNSTAGVAAGKESALRAALNTGNVAALEAAGLAPDLARELAFGRKFARLAEQIRAAKARPTSDSRWWRNPLSGSGGFREQQLQMRRDLSDALVAAFGDDLGLFSNVDANQLAFLTPAKRDALRRITQDYDEMIAKFSAGGVQLASDREKLRLLRAERERDIAAVLTTDELLAYEMRTSPTAATVRARYGDGIENEADFQKVYALQKAFDEKFPPESLSGRVSPETLRARSDAQRQLQDDIRAALGDAGYAALRRATDSDLRTVDSLVTRLHLPASTTDRIATSRDTFATDSQRINADPSLSLPQRRAQIQELGNRAKAEVTQALGAEAAEAYVQRSPWVSFLQNGLAYSTTPPPGSPGSMMPTNQSVYPVMPAGTGAPGAARQIIYSGTSTTTTEPMAHGDVFIGGANPPVRENVQVMTFSTSTSDSSVTPAPDGAVTQRTIIVAPPPAQTPPPKQ